MSTLARFDGERLELVPGEQASWQLSVTNSSQVVEAYRFQAKGDLASYARVDPAQLSLYPGTEGQVVVTIDVPRSCEVLAGEVPFAVLVAPQEDPAQPAVPEGVVAIAPFIETQAELTPRTVPARRRTTHSLAVDNQGNHPIRVGVIGEDTDDRLRIHSVPQTLVIEPGHAEFCKVKTHAHHILWRGQPQTLPFRLLLNAERAPESPLEAFDTEATDHAMQPQPPVAGQVVQRPIFPRGSGKALAAVAACLAALAVLWFALLRPTIRSAAQDAVAKPVAAAKQKAAAASKKAEEASEQAAIAHGKANEAAKAASGGAAARALSEKVKPFDLRLVVTAAPGQTTRQSFTVPKKKVVTVTDLVFDSRGDVGSVRLLRDKETLISLQSQDYRTLDQHFVSPIIFTEGEKISQELTCAKPAAQHKQCQAAIYISGTTQPKPKPPPSSSTARQAAGG